MLQRLLGSVVVAGITGAAACAKFSGEEPPSTGDAGVEAGGDGGGNPRCSGDTFVANNDGSNQWAASATLNSARLGADHVWYVGLEDTAGSRIATRPDNPAGAITPLPGIYVDKSEDEQAMLSGNQLLLVFQSNRNNGEKAIWVTKRAGTSSMFEAPTMLRFPTLPGESQDPYLVLGSLYFAHDTGNSQRAIFRVALEAASGTMAQPPEPVTQFDGQCDHPTVSADERELFFVQKIGDNEGQMMVARRTRTTDKFTNPTAISASGTNEHPTWISADGCDLWLIDADDKLKKVSRGP